MVRFRLYLLSFHPMGSFVPSQSRVQLQRKARSQVNQYARKQRAPYLIRVSTRVFHVQQPLLLQLLNSLTHNFLDLVRTGSICSLQVFTLKSNSCLDTLLFIQCPMGYHTYCNKALCGRKGEPFQTILALMFIFKRK